MQYANLPHEGSEEHGSKVTDMPPQPAAPGFARASMIERAAQHLDWTVAYGKRHSTARELEKTTSQRRRSDPPRSVRALWLRSNRAWGLRVLPISRVFLASVLASAATGIGIFLLTHSASEKAESTNALATEAPAKANEGASLMRGLAMMPPRRRHGAECHAGGTGADTRRFGVGSKANSWAGILTTRLA